MMNKENFFKIVTKITWKKNNDDISCGTGFFFKYEEKFLLVTNSHVMHTPYTLLQQDTTREKLEEGETYDFEIVERYMQEEQITAKYYLYTQQENSRRAKEIDIKFNKIIWDEQEDIAVIDITDDILESEALDITYVEPDDIPNASENTIGIMEDIILPGYPEGQYDINLHIPVICKGVTATPYRYDYSGRGEFTDYTTGKILKSSKRFIANIFATNGNSGGPVLLYTTEGIKLLGVLQMCWESNKRKNIIENTQANKTVYKELLQQSFPLCEVIKGEVLLELLSREFDGYVKINPEEIGHLYLNSDQAFL